MNELILVIVLAVWMGEAFVIGHWMGRRGFDAYRWTGIATLLGPLAAVLGVVRARRTSPEPMLLHGGGRRRHGIDILVGVDGSPESRAAVRLVARLFGDTAGRVTLARVVPIDASPDVERTARAHLVAAAEAAPRLGPSTVLLEGAPAFALDDYAQRLGYELIAVGKRGSGRSNALVGSVAAMLAREGETPVLLAQDEGADLEPATEGQATSWAGALMTRR